MKRDQSKSQREILMPLIVLGFFFNRFCKSSSDLIDRFVAMHLTDTVFERKCVKMTSFIFVCGIVSLHTGMEVATLAHF